jgi:two-component system cell cycle response regulator
MDIETSTGRRTVSGCKVLVIEDALATRRLVELSLTLEGFDVIQREDGPSGLEAARTLIPDVIVLDIALPGMDGWEVLKEIRADTKTQQIPVIVITAHDTAETRTKADHSTADSFVGKPFDLNQLRNEAHRLVGGREPHGTPVG